MATSTQKCPLISCVYNTVGFENVEDRDRHALTHYREPLICGFCSPAVQTTKVFFDVQTFKRHLQVVHQTLNVTNIAAGLPDRSKEVAAHSRNPVACRVCGIRHADPEVYASHLDDCLLRTLQPSKDEHAIHDAALRCRRSIEACRQVPELRAGEWADFRFADFNLWASGSGALAKTKLSLDRRLALQEDLRNYMVNTLTMLDVGVRQCLQAVFDKEEQNSFPSASDEPPSPTDSGNELSISEAKEDVQRMIIQLVRLTISIRKAGMQSRLNRADKLYKPKFYQTLREQLITLLRAGRLTDEQKSQGSLGISSDEEALSDVQQRLIEANQKRRHRFLYAQRHAAHLEHESAKDPATTEVIPAPRLPAISRAKSEVSQTQPSGTINEQEKLQLPAARAMSMATSVQTSHISSSAATALVEPLIMPERSEAANTVITMTGKDLEYPKAPPLQPGQTSFRCPACCQTLPSQYGRGVKWKKHIGDDLMPYTCVLPECSRPHQFYRRKDEWVKHMRDDHMHETYWLCLSCEPQCKFQTGREFDQHLQSAHADTVPAEIRQMFVSTGKRTMPLELDECPLCPVKSHEGVEPEALLDHVAQHIHAFSLNSLPWPEPGPDEADLFRKLGADPTVFGEGWKYYDQNPYFDLESQAEDTKITSDSDMEDRDGAELGVSTDAETPSERIALQEDALRVFRTELDSEHPELLAAMANLALTLYEAGELDRAVEILQDVVETRTRILGSAHADTVQSIIELISAYRAKGNRSEVKRRQVELISAVPSMLHEEYERRSDSYDQPFAEFMYPYDMSGKPCGAQLSWTLVALAANTASREYFGEYNIRCAPISRILVNHFEGTGLYERAEVFSNHLVETLRKYWAPSMTPVISSIIQHARILRAQGKLPQAEIVLADAQKDENAAPDHSEQGHLQLLDAMLHNSKYNEENEVSPQQTGDSGLSTSSPLSSKRPALASALDSRRSSSFRKVLSSIRSRLSFRDRDAESRSHRPFTRTDRRSKPMEPLQGPSNSGPSTDRPRLTLNDILNESQMSGDWQRTRLPETFPIKLERGMVDLVQGAGTIPEYRDPGLKRSFAAFLKAYKGADYVQRREEDRFVDVLLLRFYLEAATELPEGMHSDDNSWKPVTNYHSSLFIRLLLTVLHDQGWAYEFAELSVRLKDLEGQLLEDSQQTMRDQPDLGVSDEQISGRGDDEDDSLDSQHTRPAHTKILRTAISPEVLDGHGISYDIDKNDQRYHIIHASLDEAFLEELYTETKQSGVPTLPRSLKSDVSPEVLSNHSIAYHEDPDDPLYIIMHTFLDQDLYEQLHAETKQIQRSVRQESQQANRSSTTGYESGELQISRPQAAREAQLRHDLSQAGHSESASTDIVDIENRVPAAQAEQQELSSPPSRSVPNNAAQARENDDRLSPSVTTYVNTLDSSVRTKLPTGSLRDAESSYITADYSKNGDYDCNSESARETDVLIVKNKRNAYRIHFPAYSIDRGELRVRDVREQTAKKTSSDVEQIMLLHKGKQLNDDRRTCKEEGLKEGTEVVCITSGAATVAPISSGSSDEGEGGGGAGISKGKRSQEEIDMEEQRTSDVQSPAYEVLRTDLAIPKISIHESHNFDHANEADRPSTAVDDEFTNDSTRRARPSTKGGKPISKVFVCRETGPHKMRSFPNVHALEKHQQEEHGIEAIGAGNFYACPFKDCPSRERNKLWDRKDNFRHHLYSKHDAEARHEEASERLGKLMGSSIVGQYAKPISRTDSKGYAASLLQAQKRAKEQAHPPYVGLGPSRDQGERDAGLTPGHSDAPTTIDLLDTEHIVNKDEQGSPASKSGRRELMPTDVLSRTSALEAIGPPKELTRHRRRPALDVSSADANEAMLDMEMEIVKLERDRTAAKSQDTPPNTQAAKTSTLAGDQPSTAEADHRVQASRESSQSPQSQSDDLGSWRQQSGNLERARSASRSRQADQPRSKRVSFVEQQPDRHSFVRRQSSSPASVPRHNDLLSRDHRRLNTSPVGTPQRSPSPSGMIIRDEPLTAHRARAAVSAPVSERKRKGKHRAAQSEVVRIRETGPSELITEGATDEAFQGFMRREDERAAFRKVASGSRSTKAPKSISEQLDGLAFRLTELRALCVDFIAVGRRPGVERDKEYKRLSEAVLHQVLLKLDHMETEDPEARERRKALIKDSQALLVELDRVHPPRTTW